MDTILISESSSFSLKSLLQIIQTNQCISFIFHLGFVYSAQVEQTKITTL